VVYSIILFSFNSNAQNFSWAKTSGGVNATVRPPFWYPTLGTDAAGNVYQATNLSGIADFNPGSPVLNYNSSNGSSVIQKLDANGIFVWALQLGVTVTSLATDAQGYSYFTGTFTGTADLDPGPSVYPLTSMGYADVFIAKIDPAGNFLWAKQIEGAGVDAVNGLSLDANKNIIISGGYGHGAVGGTTADFDPDPFTTYILTSAGNRDAFILVLNMDGLFVKVKTWGGTNFDNAGLALGDAAGNLYSFGTFTGTVDFDGTVLSSSNQAWILTKIDAAGNYSWIRNLGTIVQVFSLSLDAASGCYISGSFAGTNDFDPGPGIYNYSAVSVQDGYYSKFNGDGSFAWAKHIRSNGVPNAITNDAAGNLYVTGSFTGSNIDFNPGAGTAYLKAPGRGTYILKVDANANFQWVKQIGGESRTNSIGRWIRVGATGEIITSLEFSGSIDADPGTAKFIIKSAGTDLCIHKLSAPPAPPIAGKFFQTSSASVFPNPAKDVAVLEINTETPGQVQYVISDLNGKRILGKSENMIKGINRISINVSDLLSGTYTLRVWGTGISSSHQILKL